MMAQSPLSDSPFDDMPWPAAGRVVLVLDGVAFSELGRRIYQWADGQPLEAQCLYVTTRWEAVSDLSPWLVWLSGPDDPVLKAFLAEGASQEKGYLLVSHLLPAELVHWMRLRLHVERVPGYEELLRIAHPALSLAVIGECLIQSAPEGAVEKLIAPNMIENQWMVREPGGGGSRSEKPSQGKVVYSSELETAFRAFNVRRDNLLIWHHLDDDAKMRLGGLALDAGYPRLCKLVVQAKNAGCRSLRDKTRYLLRAIGRFQFGDIAAMTDSQRSPTSAIMDDQWPG